jgi:UPF0755 protein
VIVNDQNSPLPFGRAASRDGLSHGVLPRPVETAKHTEPGQTIFETAASTTKTRSKQARNRFVVFSHFVLSLAVFAAIAAGGAAWYGKMRFEEPGPLAEKALFTVERNTNIRDVAVRLYTAGIIEDERIFYYGVRASGNSAKLKAGEYEIAANASMRDVMNTVISGRSVQYGVTIPEGLTVQQAWARIANNEALTGPMPAELPAEGMLIADTHTFPRGTSRESVVTRLVEMQKSLVEEIWAKRNPDIPVKDINEFVTLASIVEKETGVAEERPRVAAVFVNRLRQGMKLQSDPTIIYGIFGGAGKPSDRPIYKSDIENPTPYNTYTIDALPPGPIAIPGRAALEAVANPPETKELFFVADGTGGHVFAETYEQHNENVVKWRAIEAEREAAAKAEAEKAAAGAQSGG